MKEIFKELKFDDRGLIPVVTQDCRTDEVLMVAYMNREALDKTLETGTVHYWSRSRSKLWLKGETSGHFQKLRSISIDCDGDALLVKAEQTGAACHTGHHSCFYRKLEAETVISGEAESKEEVAEVKAIMKETDITKATSITEVTDKINITEVKMEKPEQEKDDSDLSQVLEQVFNIVKDRKQNPKEGSYTNYLFEKGLDKILKKIGEEASEVIIASKNLNKHEIKGEISDLFYHTFVLMVERGISLEDIYQELKGRR